MIADGYIEGMYNMSDPSAGQIEHSGRRKWQAFKINRWLFVMHGGCVDLCWPELDRSAKAIKV